MVFHAREHGGQADGRPDTFYDGHAQFGAEPVRVVTQVGNAVQIRSGKNIPSVHSPILSVPRAPALGAGFRGYWAFSRQGRVGSGVDSGNTIGLPQGILVGFLGLLPDRCSKMKFQ